MRIAKEQIMWKLFFKNKITEIANMYYTFCNEWNRSLLHKYVIVGVHLAIPVSYLLYLFLLQLNGAKEAPAFVVAIHAFYMYLILCVFIGVTQMGVQIFIRWIKRNLELAKKGIVVDPAWNKKVR